jgi:hypothetical protein
MNGWGCARKWHRSVYLLSEGICCVLPQVARRVISSCDFYTTVLRKASLSMPPGPLSVRLNRKLKLRA